MSKNFSVKLKYFLFLVSISLINPVFADTASTTTKSTDYMAIANNSISGVGKLIQNVNNNVAANLVILLTSVAVVLFLYGLVRFIYDRSNGDDKDLEKDKKAMGWGLAALFVLVSIWGIIKMFQGFLGIQNSGDINLPKICPNGTCEKNSGPTTPGSTGLGQPGGFNDPVKKLQTTTFDAEYSIDSIRSWSLPLKEGVAGNEDDFAQLQHFLKDHDTNSANALGTTGPNQDGIDGKFGSNTTAAVKAFQKDNALAQDGIVGPSTVAVILYRYMGAEPKNDTYYVDSWPDIMTSGQSTDANTGKMVSRLQLFLVENQHANLGDTGIQGIDGIYGGKTSTAVLQFQAKYFLKEDNLVGPSTKAVIKYIENGNN